MVVRKWDLLRHAHGVPPAAAAGEGLQGGGQLPAAPQQQAGLLHLLRLLLLLYQVLGVGTAQGLEVRGLEWQRLSGLSFIGGFQWKCVR